VCWPGKDVNNEYAPIQMRGSKSCCIISSTMHRKSISMCNARRQKPSPSLLPYIHFPLWRLLVYIIGREDKKFTALLRYLSVFDTRIWRDRKTYLSSVLVAVLTRASLSYYFLRKKSTNYTRLKKIIMVILLLVLPPAVRFRRIGQFFFC
jgi:hypothetical protein